MTLFWVVSAVLALVAAAFALRPFVRGGRAAGPSTRTLNLSVYRDQLRELDADLAAGTLATQDYERARRELERRLLEDTGGDLPPTPPAPKPGRIAGRGMALAVGLGVPLLAAAIYFAVGNPGAVIPPEQQVNAMVQRLAQRLKDNPDDAKGWALLGRSYSVMGRFAEAAQAYAQAAARAPRDAQLLVDFADALAMASGQRLQGEAEKLVHRALEIDPANLKALALAGTAAFERQEFSAAAGYWARMLPLVEPGSEDARTIQANVDEARARSGGKTASAALQGMIQLSPKLKDKVAPTDTVFIFARAIEGPPMPLAVLRKQVRDLPASFSLDDSMAMAPGLKLSGHQKVVVGARVSKSGNATPQPGDLQGVSGAVANNASGITVTIDSEVR
jgi:cytochrome c-type biogenesis protein CcmH